MQMMPKRFRCFKSAADGTIFVKFALLMPVLLGISLSAVDYAWTLTHKSVLQEAADISALAGAKELSLSDSKKENVAAVVEAMVNRYIDVNKASLASKNTAVPIVKASVTDSPLQVEVTITQKVDAIVGGALGLEFPDLKIRSVARVVGQPNICVLALEESANGAISLEQDARVTGRNCAVYSNSIHSRGMISKNSASLTASFICTRGGKDGGPGNFNPMPLVDCPSFEDPLSGRDEPVVTGGCVETDLVVNGGSRTLNPGTYCGGIHLTNNAAVEFRPGIYVFKNGPLLVDSGAAIEGSGVGLYFDSDVKSVLNVANDSSLSLEAPSTGAMAGMLVFVSRQQAKDTVHKLFSNNAPVLLGTIYIPTGELRVDASAPIAHDSAYTAIVASSMRLYGGPHLILNTDYGKTDVPVPKGIRGAGQPVSLVE
ncbi:MAG: pilus assembly protein [Alphaproteobacteria bacterium]|nr:pilus assembly protein [Alphaproteobacteria bacterium]